MVYVWVLEVVLLRCNYNVTQSTVLLDGNMQSKLFDKSQGVVRGCRLLPILVLAGKGGEIDKKPSTIDSKPENLKNFLIAVSHLTLNIGAEVSYLRHFRFRDWCTGTP